jgi:hypothetical protein
METDREWELKALCRNGYDPDMWFSESKAATNEAKYLCRNSCPVREECLAAILARESLTSDSLRFGIVAGLSGRQRAALAAARRARPATATVAPTAAAKPKKPVGSGRPLAPCGTKSAYERHRLKGEPIDQACRDAHALANREYRRTGSTRVPASR